MPQNQDSDSPTSFSLPASFIDILPEDHDYHTYIKKVIRHRLRQGGFRRISTPIVEHAEVFERALGADSDLFLNQLYTFEDREGTMLGLRPDATVSVMRSYLQHNMHKQAQPVLLYYFQPFFRFEELDKKRTYRQFWQFGFEVLGESDAALDAQVIQLANIIHRDLGMEDYFSLQINTVGNEESREEYRRVLEDFYLGKERAVPPEYKDLIHTDPAKLLDVDDEDLKIIAQMVPPMTDYIDEESLEYYEELKGYLDEMGVKYEENPTLMRGLNYYTGTVFEFWDKKKKSSDAVGGGGRYDGLAMALGSENPVPGVGYASGIERMIINMKRNKIKVPSKDELHVFVAQLSTEAKKKCLPMIENLRNAGLHVMGAIGKGSINFQLDLANRFKVPYAILMGLNEVREGTAIIRNMTKGTQETVEADEVVEKMVELIGEDNLDKYSPGELIY